MSPPLEGATRSSHNGARHLRARLELDVDAILQPPGKQTYFPRSLGSDAGLVKHIWGYSRTAPLVYDIQLCCGGMAALVGR